MPRVPTWLGGKKEEPPKTLADDLKDLGIHFHTDRFFEEDRQNIDENAGLFTDDQIDALGLTPKRAALMKQTTTMLKYIMHHAPSAKVRENRALSEAMTACIDLLHDDYERILSDAPDEAVFSEVLEDHAQMNIFVGHTFDTPRVSITKSVAVQQAMPTQGAKVEITSHESDRPN